MYVEGSLNFSIFKVQDFAVLVLLIELDFVCNFLDLTKKKRQIKPPIFHHMVGH